MPQRVANYIQDFYNKFPDRCKAVAGDHYHYVFTQPVTHWPKEIVRGIFEMATTYDRMNLGSW